MSKQRMIVTDDQLLIDMDLLFKAIREANGDWEKVEKENAPLPSTTQSGTGGKVKFSDLTPEEQKEYLQEKGYMRKWGNPKVPERTT